MKQETQTREPDATGEPHAGLGEVAQVFLKLGFIGFGGPAAHIALMQQEVVERRRWVSGRQFLDLIGAANLIPGPSSTELAIFLGYVRAGWRGLALAGTLFILPAMCIVMAIAWAYVHYGTTAVATGLLYGIKPVIIAIIAQALWGLTRTAVRSAWLAVVGVLVMRLYFAGVNPVILLFGGALVVLLVENARRWRRGGADAAALALFAFSGRVAPTLVPFSAGLPFSMPMLFLTFLKVGAVVYGSGYVLLAFLQTDLVDRLGWLTNRQLIDAVAVGQFTPGPVFTTATFIGYLVGGWTGAIVATVAIFLPSFVFVAAVYPFVPRLRSSPWMRGFLDGASVAALGLMAAVTLQLARAAFVDPVTVALALAAGFLLFRFKVNSVWLVLGGGLIGEMLSRILH